MSLETIYVAALFQDAKKLELNNDPTNKNSNWGTWRPDHIRLDDRTTQGDNCDLGVDSKKPLLENEDQILALKLHQRLIDQKSVGLEDLTKNEYKSRISGLDPIALFALMVSDAIHKSLYEADRSLSKDETRSYWRSPFFTPFYLSAADARPICWMPVDNLNQIPTRIRDILPQAIGGEVQFKNSRGLFKRFLHKIQNEEGKQFLSAKEMIEWQESIFSSFPDSTYSPMTSLNFHHRFVAAITLLIDQRIRSWVCENTSANQEITIGLRLNIILCPPEILTNRLRDTSLVRKISHRLQLKLHDYFKDAYLQPLQRFGFDHPDLNPFFFYNKEAIVLINGETDQKAIERICKCVAEETESLITLNSIPIDAQVEIAFEREVKEGENLKGFEIFDVSVSEKNGKQKLIVLGDSETKDQIRTPFLGFSEDQKKVKEAVNWDEVAYCFVCNKGTDELQADREDQLCNRCYNLRKEHRFCQDCNIYFSARQSKQDNEPCILCGRKAGWPKTSQFLQGPRAQENSSTDTQRKKFPANYSVAYVLIKKNATLEGIKLESAVQMSIFRHLRDRFENPNNPTLIRKPDSFADRNGITDLDRRILDRIDQLFAQNTKDEYGMGILNTDLQNSDPKLKNRGDRIKKKLEEYIGRGLLSNPNRMKQLVTAKPTPSGIFEYLQAVLNIEQFQGDLRKQLREALRETQRRQSNERHNFGGYPIKNKDWSPEALDQHMLYRSPTATLLVMPEPTLRLFYPKLLQLTQGLHIAHELRIVTCPYNTPVWQVLDNLKLVGDEAFFTCKLRKTIEDFSERQRQLLDKQAADPQLLDMWEKSEKIRTGYQKDVRRLSHLTLQHGNQPIKLSPQEITLTVIRGSAPRTFKDGIAHHLLTFQPQSASAPAQIHWLAEFASRQIHSIAEYASQLSEEVTSDNDLEWLCATLNLEIDARSNPSRRMSSGERLPIALATEIKRDVANLVAQIKRGAKDVKIETIPAFLREMANLHKIPTGIDGA